MRHYLAPFEFWSIWNLLHFGPFKCNQLGINLPKQQTNTFSMLNIVSMLIKDYMNFFWNGSLHLKWFTTFVHPTLGMLTYCTNHSRKTNELIRTVSVKMSFTFTIRFLRWNQILSTHSGLSAISSISVSSGFLPLWCSYFHLQIEQSCISFIFNHYLCLNHYFYFWS